MVIGAGHNGLVAAIHLAAHGLDVTVLEHAPRPGYVLGARAGQERYAQIVGAVERASRRLDAFSSRHAPDGHDEGSRRADRDP